MILEARARERRGEAEGCGRFLQISTLAADPACPNVCMLTLRDGALAQEFNHGLPLQQNPSCVHGWLVGWLLDIMKLVRLIGWRSEGKPSIVETGQEQVSESRAVLVRCSCMIYNAKCLV